MKIRPYRPGDFDHIRHRPRDTYGDEAIAGQKLMCEMGNSCVAEHDGIPIAIWGTVKLWDHVVYVWTMVGDDARGKGLALTKTIRDMLDEYCEAHDIIRCESYVKRDIEENIKWVKLLGFEYECTHKFASPTGGDLDIYVRLYHERRKQ